LLRTIVVIFCSLPYLHHIVFLKLYLAIRLSSRKCV